MPPTARSINDELSIELLNPSTPSFPGSVILGRVMRQAPVNAPSATVRVRLQGRAKAKLVVSRGESKSYYRSRFKFWSESAVVDTVHDGPVSDADNGPLSWPFALAVPTHTSADALNFGLSEKERSASFVKVPGQITASAGIPEQPLPGSFYYDYSGFSKKWHGFVEFWIEAELAVQGTAKSRARVFKATLPIRINSPPAPGPPITDFRLETRNMPGCVSSHRLVPGMEDGELSFRQKRQRFFGSSKVPSLRYVLQVRYPTVIQLGSPSTIPFLLRVIPDREKSSEIIADVSQTLTIKSVELEVRTTVSIICPGTFDWHSTDQTRKVLLASTSTFSSLIEGGVALPFGADEKPLDLGALLGIKVDAMGRVLKEGRETPINSAPDSIIVPTYTTYCVKTEHELVWQVALTVAGESWKCSTTQKLLVLPQSQDMLTNGTESADLKGFTPGGVAALAFGATAIEFASNSASLLEVVAALSELDI
ncbi:hypothetical protein CCHL11_04150 [Colletotrichum chlorophyti]|uniref:Arrestin-like N-terminal domain-containing protein n=1 Tax=Colletotrichum chlorophyti TaxID=708187 RepID=A0A1Q8RPC9_9PEZI|nr:hypothetical protein CCHL11_04150 [Colletotrichum chlorophyti]